MARNIGGITVDLIWGLPLPLKTRTETWEVSGLNGYGAQILGKGNAEFEVKTVKFASSNQSNTDANTHITSCAALQGTTVTIVDGFGDSYVNLLIKECDPTNAKKRVIYNGDPTAVRVEINWKVCTAF